jgi:hypothetical protein
MPKAAQTFANPLTVRHPVINVQQLASSILAHPVALRYARMFNVSLAQIVLLNAKQILLTQAARISARTLSAFPAKTAQ